MKAKGQLLGQLISIYAYFLSNKSFCFLFIYLFFYFAQVLNKNLHKYSFIKMFSHACLLLEFNCGSLKFASYYHIDAVGWNLSKKCSDIPLKLQWWKEVSRVSIICSMFSTTSIFSWQKPLQFFTVTTSDKINELVSIFHNIKYSYKWLKVHVIAW